MAGASGRAGSGDRAFCQRGGGDGRAGQFQGDEVSQDGLAKRGRADSAAMTAESILRHAWLLLRMVLQFSYSIQVSNCRAGFVAKTSR